jgi:hypothetical protein
VCCDYALSANVEFLLTDSPESAGPITRWAITPGELVGAKDTLTLTQVALASSIFEQLVRQESMRADRSEAVLELIVPHHFDDPQAPAAEDADRPAVVAHCCAILGFAVAAHVPPKGVWHFGKLHS